MALQLYISPGSIPSKLKIDSLKDLTVFNFHLADQNWIHFTTGDVSISNNKKLTTQMFLDDSSGFVGNGMFNFRNVEALAGGFYDSLEIVLDGSLLMADTGTVSKKYALSEFPLHTPFTFEVIKSFQSIDSIKINGIEQTAIGTTSAGGSSNSSGIGYSGRTEYYLKNATLWNVEITDLDTDVLIHKWLGSGAANQDSAWVDLGSIGTDGDIRGTNPTTRIVSGLSQNTSKLLLELP